MKTWASSPAGIEFCRAKSAIHRPQKEFIPGEYTAASVDRDKGEGPPRCCMVRLVGADGLVWWGGLPAELLSRARARLPRLAEIPDLELYLCGGCRETLLREKLVTREEVARGLGLAAAFVAKAWLHDEEFWHRGPESAPAEVQAQAWWPAYQSLALTTPRGRLRGEVQKLLREMQWSARDVAAAE